MALLRNLRAIRIHSSVRRRGLEVSLVKLGHLSPVSPLHRTSCACRTWQMAILWVPPRSAGCPVIGGSGAARPPPNFAASGCPVVGANPANQMPPSANEPLPGQSKPLSTWRQSSSIPTSAGTADALPQHQRDTAGEVGHACSCGTAVWLKWS